MTDENPRLTTRWQNEDKRKRLMIQLQKRLDEALRAGRFGTVEMTVSYQNGNIHHYSVGIKDTFK